MNQKEFENIVSYQLTRCENVLNAKAHEYAEDDDRLHNFTVAGQMQGVSPRVALGGMMAKHTVSIYDMINSDEEFSDEMWSEKITDHLNYLLLLKAVLAEERTPYGTILDKSTEGTNPA